MLNDILGLEFPRLRGIFPDPETGKVFFVDTIVNLCIMRHLGGKLNFPANDNDEGNDVA